MPPRIEGPAGKPRGLYCFDSDTTSANLWLVTTEHDIGSMAMISTTSGQVVLRTFAAPLLALSLLWLSMLPAAAGELSGVSESQPLKFSLPDLSGKPHNLNEFTGKVLLVNFWASWCRPCIEEMPSIQRLTAAMTDAPFVVIGVNVGEAERRVRATARRLGIAFPVLLDADSAVFRAWGADVLPTTFVLDSRGRVRYVGRGPVEWDQSEIIDLLKRLAADSPAGELKPGL